MTNLNSGSPPLALCGGTVFVSPDERISNGAVIIDNGQIAAAGVAKDVRIPDGALSLDCSWTTIMAGFWNSHVHFMERKWANAAEIPAEELSRQLQQILTRYGFTSVFDLSSPWENTRVLRDRIESGEVPGPQIRSTGLGLLPANPGVPDIVVDMMGWMKTPLTEIADAAQAAATSAERLRQGVDAIKLFISAPSKASLSEAAIRAAVNEAHRSGKPVFAHPNSGDDVLRAVRGGVDIIAHTTPGSGTWDQSILEAIRPGRFALTPTLTIWKHYARHDRISAQDHVVDAELAQLRAWIAAGGDVLFGNDLGAVDYDPADEYLLMCQAGMSFRQVLASLTTTPAGRFGESKLGRIASGFQADLVVTEGDPSRDIHALTSVRYTLRRGEIIYRAAGLL